MAAVDKQQSIPLNLRFTGLSEATPPVPVAMPTNGLYTNSKPRSIFDAVQPDVVFIQDMSQGVADTSWERQEASAWVSDDDEDSSNIEAHLQTARLCSTMKRLSIAKNGLIDMDSPNSSVASHIHSSPVASVGCLSSTSDKLVEVNSRGKSQESSRELVEFLREADLENWIEKFVEQEIYLDCIGELSDNDLIGLGMIKIGTRRKFQRIAREWLQQKKSN